MNKIKFILLILILLFSIQYLGFAKEEFVVGLADHELGDQTIAICAGLFIPLPFMEFNGGTFPANQTLGGAGSLQWNAYLNSFFRIGLEVGGSFSYGPDKTSFLMVPVTAKATYVFSYDRFEFPIFLGAGINILKYGNPGLYDAALILKPGFAAYYRYNSNISIGLNVIWWWNVEFPSPDYENAIMGNVLETSLSLFYHF